MRKTILLLAGVACLITVITGLLHSFLTFVRTEADLSDNGQKRLNEILVVKTPLGDVGGFGTEFDLEHEFIVNGISHTTMKSHVFYSLGGPGTEAHLRRYILSTTPVIVYYNELFPGWWFHERPRIIRSDMADSLWGVSLIFILLAVGTKTGRQSTGGEKSS